MGKIDSVLNHFLRDNQVFSDILNLSIYQGRKVILPEGLEDGESVQYVENHLGNLRERRNDVCKRYRNGCSYRIFCLENESKVSYIMPVRGMEYEAGRYREQIRKISRRHKKGDYQNWGELSSGFARDDKLFPVITLVLYWQREPWDGAKNLIDMLWMTEEEQAILRPYLQNYKLNLVNMYDLENLESCESQLKHVLKLLKMDQDREAIYREVVQNPEYENLHEETGRVIATLLGDKELGIYMDNHKTEGGNVNMCKALDDIRKEAKSQGIQQGIQQGMQSFALLTQKLLLDSRTDDLMRATRDLDWYKKLCGEYGIEI